jgi:repressor LexA
MKDLTPRQRQVLEYIDEQVRQRGFPPSVREIGEAVGLTSTSTVHAHVSALVNKGYINRHASRPRALEVKFEPSTGAAVERRPLRNVPVVGHVAAGTGVLAAENIDEVQPIPADFIGDGPVFMLKVRGESMVEAGIFDGDHVVVRQQNTAEKGDVVVAGIPDDEATIKTFLRKGDKIVLRPANAAFTDMVYRPDEVTIFGKVVALLRRY